MPVVEACPVCATRPRGSWGPCETCIEDDHARRELDAELEATTAASMLLALHDEPVEAQCVVCGEPRGPDQFEDGLRCKMCAEAEEEAA